MPRTEDPEDDDTGRPDEEIVTVDLDDDADRDIDEAVTGIGDGWSER
jgi:hypothetical protein